jgi:hypothetical protein
MFGFEVILILMIIRVLLPLALILWMGESVRRREVKNLFWHPSR